MNTRTQDETISRSTAARHRRVSTRLPLEDRSDFVAAAKGFLGTQDHPLITGQDGEIIWDLQAFGFLSEGTAPESAHPSLWRLGQLNLHHGLFEVAEGIYQVRGFDISNMSVILGETGYVVIDPLTCTETAAAAMSLVREHLGDRPVTGMLYTHSHIDHFGGAAGIVDPEDVHSGTVPVIAPEGFLDHAVAEHIHSGVAVSRRSQFMFGRKLPLGPEGQIGAGLGFSLPSGSITLVYPTHEVGVTGEELTLDGVRLSFQFTPGAEAPAEFNVFLPEKKALCMAENVSQHMHNLYTLRGAQVRDALAWSSYLDEAITLYGDEAEVMFNSHHWPVWGREKLVEHIGMHRDLYRYIHDETLRLANHGLTPVEIAECLSLPDQLANSWANRGCYGSLNHNVKAVYQRYLGWFDANPANLHPLPPAEAGRRYVELMGGAATVVRHARQAHGIGEDRWAAELLKHVLAAEPDHKRANQLQAQVFTQLGFQSESGPWRNFYLLAAAELSGQVAPVNTFVRSNAKMAPGMSVPMLLNFMAIRLNGMRAAAEELQVILNVKDQEESFLLQVGNGILRFRPVGDENGESTGTTALSLQHTTLAELTLGALTFAAAESTGRLWVTGDRSPITVLFDLLDDFGGDFSVVTPNLPA